MTDATVKLSVKEKLGYGVGDMAANFVFQSLLVFQLIFYTETFGISAAAAGTLILVVGIGSAYFDPIMGILADRTNTRWGRFRPWVIATAVPFGIVAVLAFATPNLSPHGKLLYAYITFTLLMLVYSANNVPYSALTGVITGDMKERTSLSSYRQVFANSSAFIVQGLALPMVLYLGHGNRAVGYKLTMGVFAILSVIFFCITFFSTTERIKPDPNQKTSLGQDLKDLGANTPWVVLFIVTVLIFIGLSMRSATMLYYFKYCSLNEKLFSPFNIVGLGSLLVGVMLSTASVKRWGSKPLFIAALAISAAFAGALILVPATSIPLVFGLEVGRQFAWGLTAPILWAMMADVADFSEWKTGRRATAMVFAATVFGLKAGLSIGRAIAAWILSVFGYVPNAVQTAHSILGIKLLASVFTMIVFFLGVACLFLYKIDTATGARMADELAERRKGYAV